MLKVQLGEPLLHLPPENKIVQEPSFSVKVNKVLEALNVSHILAGLVVTNTVELGRTNTNCCSF